MTNARADSRRVGARHRATRRFLALLSAAILGGLLGASAALAYTPSELSIPGATYTGTNNVDGTVSFTISNDGSAVTNFHYVDDDTGFKCNKALNVASIPIDHVLNGDERFTNGDIFSDNDAGIPPGVVWVDGRFREPQQSSGIIVKDDCGTDQYLCCAWTATTTASPAGSKQCQRSLKQRKKAKKKLKNASTPSEKRKAKKQLHDAHEALRDCGL
jgi:hypothetical protein